MRRAIDRTVAASAAACAAAACAVLLGLVAVILWRALPVLSWEFVASPTAGAGAGGGVAYQLAGTAVLVVTAFVVAAPLATGLALVEAVYLRGRRHRRYVQLGLYLWNGLPSILLGVFGLLFFDRILGWGKSWLAGGIVLGLMILPTVALARAKRIEAVPDRYLEAASGLGLSRSRVIRSVVLPQSRNGLVSGSLLGLARAAGETAPIMFTAAVFSGVGLPEGIRESPVLALPYHIFVLAQDAFDPGAAERIWGAAFVLLAVVFSFSLAALPVRLRGHEEADRG